MRYWPRKLRGPLKLHGGKSYLARRILPLAPPSYDVLVDAFGGGGSITLNAPPGVAARYNDADWRKANVLSCLKDPRTYRELVGRLGAAAYDEATFQAARARDSARGDGPPPAEERVAAAAEFVVRNRFSRGGLGRSFAYSDRQRGGQPGDVNAWQTLKASLPLLHARLRDVTVTCTDAIPLLAGLRSQAEAGTRIFAYLDPPYLQATRTVPAAYGRFEMSDEEHRRLLEICLGMTQRVNIAISGYRNELYDELLSGWRRFDIDMPNHSGQGEMKQRRTECLWMNYDAGPERVGAVQPCQPRAA